MMETGDGVSRAWLIVMFSAVLLCGLTVTIGWYWFSASEREIQAYCNQRLIGQTLVSAVSAAKKQNLQVSIDAKASSDKTALVSAQDASFWSAASFCSLAYDSTVITGVSYNPWYH